jgi:hypothetical protein
MLGGPTAEEGRDRDDPYRDGRHRRALPDRSAAAERGGQATLVLSPVQSSSIRAAILSVAARINAAPDRSVSLTLLAVRHGWRDGSARDSLPQSAHLGLSRWCSLSASARVNLA